MVMLFLFERIDTAKPKLLYAMHVKSRRNLDEFLLEEMCVL